MAIFFSNRLKPRGFYAIRTGEYTGCFATWIQEYDREESCAFLIQPNPMKMLYWDRQEVKSALKTGTLDFVHKLPEDVYAVSKACFEHHNNRKTI